MAKKNSEKDSLMEAVSKELKSNFDLNKFKEKKSLGGNVKFKEQAWIPFSPAMQDALSIPGIGIGHVNMVRGRSNTGKTTTSIETVVSAQKMGILPILIITEMKHDWQHWKTMGFEMNEILDKDGNVVDYDGFFIYKDRGKLGTIEDVADFVLDMLNEQDKGNLPYDLLFMWDSVGSIPCRMSVEKANNNPMWNAGAVAVHFGNFINQRIMLSRKEESKYTNTMLVINKVGVAPAENIFSQPRMTNKNGDTFYWDASLCFTFGNVTNSGTSKIKAQNNGKDIEFALRTKVACDKNHINGITTRNTVISTVHGFIPDDKKEITKYKKDHSHEWADILGKGDYKTVEDNSEWNEKEDISDIVESED
jgi:hypothetical protein